MSKYPEEVAATMTRASSKTNHSTAEMNSASMGDSSGRILSLDPSESDQERTRMVEWLARRREWVSMAQMRFGLSTSKPGLPAPSSPNSSQAMHPNSVLYDRLDIASFCKRLIQQKEWKTLLYFRIVVGMAHSVQLTQLTMHG
ncbi:hypothetical protein SESBI_46538 [Sesbania bispinosa]|nr:hypothetical protein SESBI_46538 [Sesbania bispinosa]